jgi:hypothetical protein
VEEVMAVEAMEVEATDVGVMEVVVTDVEDMAEAVMEVVDMVCLVMEDMVEKECIMGTITNLVKGITTKENITMVNSVPRKFGEKITRRLMEDIC